MLENTSPQPKVSVFIASYNHARFLPTALESILSQTYKDFEIVIVDDGSTDDSLKVAKGYANRFPSKIKVLTHPNCENKGISASCNLAIKNTRGEYLAWIGADDVWYPEKLELQVAQLSSNPNLGLVYGSANVMDEEGRELTGQYIGTNLCDTPNPFLYLMLVFWIPASTIMLRRQCLEKVGLFDESLVYSDWELCIRIASHWQIGFIGRPLARYRIHSQNISKNQSLETDFERNLAIFLALQNKAPKIGGNLAKPRSRALIQFKLSYYYFCMGNIAEAHKRLFTAFEIDPSIKDDVKSLAEWVYLQRFDLVQPDKNIIREQDFGSWLISSMFPSYKRSYLKPLKVALYTRKAYGYFRSGDLKIARKLMVKCVAYSPVCLSDRWVRSVSLEVFIWPRLLRVLRLLKSRLF